MYKVEIQITLSTVLLLVLTQHRLAREGGKGGGDMPGQPAGGCRARQACAPAESPFPLPRSRAGGPRTPACSGQSATCCPAARRCRWASALCTAWSWGTTCRQALGPEAGREPGMRVGSWLDFAWLQQGAHGAVQPPAHRPPPRSPRRPFPCCSCGRPSARTVWRPLRTMWPPSPSSDTLTTSSAGDGGGGDACVGASPTGAAAGWSGQGRRPGWGWGPARAWRPSATRPPATATHLAGHDLACSLTRVGVMVLICHEMNDIFLEAAKMGRYAESDFFATLFFVGEEVGAGRAGGALCMAQHQ